MNMHTHSEARTEERVDAVEVGLENILRRALIKVHSQGIGTVAISDLTVTAGYVADLKLSLKVPFDLAIHSPGSVAELLDSLADEIRRAG